MPHIIVENFQAGLDTRKMPVTATPGTLMKLSDGHITRGGEIEKRKAFVNTFLLPASTFGLASAAGQFYTFGSADTPTGIPASVEYQKLDPGDGSNMTDVNSWDFFDGKPYVSAAFDSGLDHHFYDAALVSEIRTQGYTPGKSVKTVKKKVYFTSGALTHFCNLNDPMTWVEDDTSDPPLVGAGFINMSNEASGSENLQGLGNYFDNVGVLARGAVQIWFMDDAPEQNVQLQVLNNTGTVARRSITEFGDNDLFYLDESGIRSLRARNSSNAAFVDDVGTAIDTLVQEAIHASREDTNKAIGVIETHEGRFILSLGDQSFVFSYFPSSKISAWSTYNQGFRVTDWADDVSDQEVIAARGDNNVVYLLGGESGDVYDDAQMIARLPFLSADNPVKEKTWNKVNVAAEGRWEVWIYMSTQEDLVDFGELIGEIDGTTYDMPELPIDRTSTHLSIEFRSIGNGKHKIGQVVLTHDEEE